MLEQAFNQYNLSKIYNKNISNGTYFENFISERATSIQDKIYLEKKFSQTVTKKRDRISDEIYDAIKTKIVEKINALEKMLKEEVDAQIETISKQINNKKFRIKLLQCDRNMSSEEKNTYKTVHESSSFFAEKQLQHNIKSTYKVKQSDRNIILPQLISILEENIPKYIIRTDITNFYESIDREILKRKIGSKPQLSLMSRKMIKKLLTDYDELSGQSQGIPRGVGVSAYLSELFMQDLDYSIRTLPNLIYYARYVDDIVAIFSPNPDQSIDIYLEGVTQIIDRNNLSLNEAKTKCVEFVSGRSYKFEYLGYTFEYQGSLKVSLSNKKKKKYKERLKASLKAYNESSKSKNSKKLLLNRIRLLTGNTRLSHRKKGAFVGIYYSNKYISDPDSLRDLDFFLTNEVNRIDNARLRSRLLKYSFKKGFVEKSFRNFTPYEILKITRAWKHQI